MFARESAGSVTIELDQASNKVSIQSVASQLGENTAEAEAEITGAGKITLNSRYILDALGSIEEDRINISFNGKLEPCVIRPAGISGHTHVVMPLKS